MCQNIHPPSRPVNCILMYPIHWKFHIRESHQQLIIIIIFNTKYNTFPQIMFRPLALVIRKQVTLYYFEKFSSVLPVILKSHVYPWRQKLLFISFNENIPEFFILQIKTRTRWLSYTDIFGHEFLQTLLWKTCCPWKWILFVYGLLCSYTRSTADWYIEKLHITVLSSEKFAKKKYGNIDNLSNI